MLDFVLAAQTVVSHVNNGMRYVTKGAIDLPYTQSQSDQIEFAGQYAALDIIEEAIRQKMIARALHCPMSRESQGYSSTVTFEVNNLSLKRYTDPRGAIVKLSSSWLAGFPAKALDVVDVKPDLARFNVSCPPTLGGRQQPLKFMEFFQALGFDSDLRGLDSTEQAWKAINCADIKWVGHHDHGYFQQNVSGQTRGVSSTHVVCPMVGLLQVLDIKPETYTKAVTAARLQKAEEFGPVRATRRQSLGYHLNCA